MQTEPYRQSLTVRWADLDSNGHMSNTAYLDACVDVRFGYFTHRGVPPAEIARMGIGPVVRRDEVTYHRELRLHEIYEVDLRLAGISDDGSHFSIANSFARGDGKLAAVVVSTGGWLDLSTRKLTTPPAAIVQALLALPRTEDYRALQSSLRP